MTIWPRDVWYTSLYCSLFSSCDVLFGVFVLPLVCHGNWVRSFLITYFFSPFLLPCNWTQSPGKYGLSPKDINVSAKVSFSEPMEEWGKKKRQKEELSHCHILRLPSSLESGYFPNNLSYCKSSTARKGAGRGLQRPLVQPFTSATIPGMAINLAGSKDWHARPYLESSPLKPARSKCWEKEQNF